MTTQRHRYVSIIIMTINKAIATSTNFNCNECRLCLSALDSIVSRKIVVSSLCSFVLLSVMCFFSVFLLGIGCIHFFSFADTKLHF